MRSSSEFLGDTLSRSSGIWQAMVSSVLATGEYVRRGRCNMPGGDEKVGIESLFPLTGNGFYHRMANRGKLR
jgi:hypothetical protein